MKISSKNSSLSVRCCSYESIDPLRSSFFRSLFRGCWLVWQVCLGGLGAAFVAGLLSAVPNCDQGTESGTYTFAVRRGAGLVSISHQIHSVCFRRQGASHIVVRCVSWSGTLGACWRASSVPSASAVIQHRLHRPTYIPTIFIQYYPCY